MQKSIEEIRALDLNINDILNILGKVLSEREGLYKALSRVQGRCTELEMERRALQAELKRNDSADTAWRRVNDLLSENVKLREQIKQ